MASNGNGVLKYNRNTLTQYNTGNTPILGTNQVLSIKTDVANNIWIGTWGSGLVRYAQGTVGVNAKSEKQQNINIFPNPCTNELYITGVVGKTKKVEIYSAEGILLENKIIYDSSASIYINTETLPKGLYFVKIITHDNYFIEKIIRIN